MSAEAPQDQPPSTPSAEPLTWSAASLLNVVSKVGPPLTIVTALLIYFGWARANAQSKAMGIDVSMFGYSTQDYVLRSVSTLYLPLLTLCGVGLAWLTVHRRLMEYGTDAERLRVLHRAGIACLAVGLVVAVAALIVGWRLPDRWPLVIPLALAGGTAVAAYGSYLIRVAGEEKAVRPADLQKATRAVLIGGIVALAFFWELSSYATVVGNGYAQRIADTVDHLPRVVVTSPEPLGVQANGVAETAVSLPVQSGAGSVRYRTTGLRLLVSSGGRLFLLSDGWKPGRGSVVVLPDDKTLHWQFSR